MPSKGFYMRYMIFYLLSLFLTPLILASNSEGTLTCSIQESPRKIIKCIYTTQRLNVERNLTFEWSNALTPQDHRIRTVLMPSGHASVYDYRNYYGRAKGEWHISVKDDEDKSLASTTFNLE